MLLAAFCHLAKAARAFGLGRPKSILLCADHGQKKGREGGINACAALGRGAALDCEAWANPRMDKTQGWANCAPLSAPKTMGNGQ